MRNVGLTAIIYCMLGALGISFAIAPGYASPIFPAAGFAVAIHLYSNNRLWPGVWLGSAILNLGITWLRGDLDWSTSLIACAIASGSTTQAFVSRWLVTRLVGNGWRTLEIERDIFLTLLLAGPVAGIISASIGVGVLQLAQINSADQFLFAWFNWWAGDTLGIVVLLPISLAFLYRQTSPWSSRITMLVIPMLMALVVVVSAFYAVSQWERSNLKQAIQVHGENLANQLKQRFIAHQEVLAALHRLIVVTPEMTYKQFEYFTRISLRDNPDIFALSFNPYVLQTQRQAFEQTMAVKTGLPSFQIQERDSNAKLIRAADRPFYVAVGYIAPLESNRAAAGYNINSEPLRHDAIQRAMLSGKPAITAPIKLVQENRQRVGVLMLQPTIDEAISASKDGEGDLTGFAVGVIKVDEMVEIATHDYRIPGLIFQLDDAQAPDDKALFYRSEDTQPSSDNAYLWQTQLNIADRLWNLKLAPSKEYLLQHHHFMALLVGIWGIVLVALLQVLLLITTGRASIFQNQVRQQTAELQAKSDTLEDSNEQLQGLLMLSPDGFVTFNRENRVQYVSPAFTQLLGLTETQVLGLHETEFSELLQDLCMPSSRFRGLEAFRSAGSGDKLRWDLLELSINGKVLQVGMRLNQATAGNVSQILYFHDITHESEVARMKSEFLSTAAHELRTPMSSIYGFSEMLLNQDFDKATLRELIGIIYDQSKLMIKIINELLDLSRIEARRGKDFVYEFLAVEELLANVVANFKFPENRAAPIVAASQKPIFIHADRSKTQQAIINLLANAYKYSPEGGEVEIAILEREAEGKSWVGIEVRDQGIGMTAEQQKRATERFYRADESGAIPGSGLGLSIVKEIVELQGGELIISSELGVGSSLLIWFPQRDLPDGNITTSD